MNDEIKNNNASAKPFPWQLAAVALAACGGLSTAAYVFGVQPLLDGRAQEAAQRQLLEERQASATQLSNTLADLHRQLAGAKEQLERTPVRLQPASLINQRLEAVARLATDCHVSLDEMRPGSAADATHFQTVAIRIVGSGKYPACATFLKKHRETFGDMGVRTFTANNTAAGSENPVAIFNAELVWFTELPRATAAAAPRK
jgi:Tfp pilus assembly protein PilO